MKVKSLDIVGFRGIDELRLEFDPRLTVIVGENGVGKTSVLDALAILLDNYVARFVKASPQAAERLRDTDATADAPETALGIVVEEADNATVRWVVRRQARAEKILQPRPSELDDLNAFVRRQVEARGDAVTGATLMVYYGQRRAVLDMPQRLRGGSQQEPEAAFSDSLKLGDLNFREFVAWFRDHSYDEMRSQVAGDYQPDRQLRAVSEAMTKATGLKQPMYKGNPSGLYIVKDEACLRVDQLSSGERTFLALAGDLARRLCMLNPDVENPLTAPGIVLIDEVELHLHPRWQRTIIPWLLETFTGCQFIIATHSPQVLGHVHADGIRVLRREDGQVRWFAPSASHGRDSNYILVSVLGGEERDKPVADKLSELDAAISAEDLGRAKAILSELYEMIEGPDPKLTLAEHRLRRRLRDQPQ